MFQDGSLKIDMPHILEVKGYETPSSLFASVPAGANRLRSITLPEGSHISQPFFSPPEPMVVGGRMEGCTRAETLAQLHPVIVQSQALPFQQFHVLFNSLFKVLFIFRSLYLCAIGLSPVFSFR